MINRLHFLKRFFWLLVAGYGLLCSIAYAQQDRLPRNVQISVEFKTQGFLRQGAYQSTHRGHDRQFLLVMDGAQGRLFIGKHLPYQVWFRDYLNEEGYLKEDVVFRNVGTGLIVEPRIRGRMIELTVTPEISYETGDGKGSIAVKKLSTTIMVSNGGTINVGGGTQASEFENNFFKRTAGERVSITLSPRIMD